ncbi:mucin-5AC-like [Calliphora vicina]|uniref:mucin-5AC-like n=1 Tax=Calliphora vicina TaxID=7373 RepID=UPI00325B43E9
MLQRGLLTNAEQQQQQQKQPPYDTTRATTTATHEINLLKEQEHLGIKHNSSSNRQDSNEEYKERINCLPIIEMPEIKIEQDVEYMEGIEEEQPELQQVREDVEDVIEEPQAMELEQEEMSIKPVPQLLEPTSILKTSLLTGAANTLATLTAAAEQIARMPNESLTKNYPYFKEENKRTYTVEEDQTTKAVDERRMSASSSTTNTTTTYTSILQTALMSKRPATLNVAATASSATCTKTLHVRTPDQVLKTAVTLATLGEIAAQQEQQQLQQSQQQQQPHILVVPQVQPTLRKMCTLPFKKLNFANVTSTSSATCLTNTASLNTSNITNTTTTTTTAAAATTTTITNNYLGSNIKTNTNLTNSSSCILNTHKQAASNNRETTTATFFDTNNIINNVTICSNSSNSNSKSQAMATQTLKIPTIKPQLVTTQTQTEEETNTNTTTSTPLTLATTSNNSASSLQTASCSGLLRTAVPTNTKLLTQNSLNTSLTNKFPAKTKTLAHENVATCSPATNVADPVVGHIIKHVSSKNKTGISPASPAALEACDAPAATNTATNVTVVVFETLLPED